MVSFDDINTLYVYALEGNIEHINFLITNINFDFIHIVKAYRYSLERGLKLQGNYKIRESINNKINIIRNNRKIQIDKLNIQNDLTLLEQGKLALSCSNYLYTIIEPLLHKNDYITLLFFHLAKINNLEIIKDFVLKYDNYINFDYQNENGRTALHVACIYNNEYIINFLLNYCDINKQDYYNKHYKILHNTALHYAVENKNLLIIKLLLTKNINVNIKNYFELMPLNYVEPGPDGNVLIFELLLNSGANINIKSCNKTLIYKLVEQNDPIGLEYVLKLGADPYITSSSHYSGKSSRLYYETPLMLATNTIYQDFEDYIKNYKIISILTKYNKLYN